MAATQLTLKGGFITFIAIGALVSCAVSSRITGSNERYQRIKTIAERILNHNDLEGENNLTITFNISDEFFQLQFAEESRISSLILGDREISLNEASLAEVFSILDKLAELNYAGATLESIYYSIQNSSNKDGCNIINDTSLNSVQGKEAIVLRMFCPISEVDESSGLRRFNMFSISAPDIYEVSVSEIEVSPQAALEGKVYSSNILREIDLDSENTPTVIQENAQWLEDRMQNLLQSGMPINNPELQSLVSGVLGGDK